MIEAQAVDYRAIKRNGSKGFWWPLQSGEVADEKIRFRLFHSEYEYDRLEFRLRNGQTVIVRAKK